MDSHRDLQTEQDESADQFVRLSDLLEDSAKLRLKKPRKSKPKEPIYPVEGAASTQKRGCIPGWFLTLPLILRIVFGLLITLSCATFTISSLHIITLTIDKLCFATGENSNCIFNIGFLASSPTPTPIPTATPFPVTLDGSRDVITNNCPKSGTWSVVTEKLNVTISNLRVMRTGSNRIKLLMSVDITNLTPKVIQLPLHENLSVENLEDLDHVAGPDLDASHSWQTTINPLETIHNETLLIVGISNTATKVDLVFQNMMFGDDFILEETRITGIPSTCKA